MASRISEVIYQLIDRFTGPSKKVAEGYDRIKQSSRAATKSIGRDSKQQQAALFGLQGGVDKLMGSWRALAGAVGIGSVAGGFKSIVDEADRVGKAASKIGIATEELSKLAYAASKENINFTALETGLQRMTRRIGAAAQGSAELEKTFAALGLSVDELAQLAPEEAFYRIADATRAIGNEKEQLALFFKIFDTEGVNLIRLARQGSEALKGYGKEAERLGKIFGKEFVDNAAKFNDSLTALDARLDGAKINLFSDALAELVEFLDNTGNGDYLAGITAELLQLERLAEQNSFQRYLQFETRPLGVLRNRISELRYEIRQLSAQQEKSAASADKDVAARKAQAEAAKDYQFALEGLTETYDANAKAQERALKTETDQLRKARSEQSSIEKEFANLVDDIRKPEPSDVSLADVFYADTKARAALAQGDIEASIRFAREGADLLGQLKEKGTETQGTLGFLAEKLQAVATEAAGKKVDAELIDVDQAQAALDGFKNKLGALKTDAATEGTAIGKALVSAITAELAAANLSLPAINAPVARRSIERDGNSFSFRTELDKGGAK